VVPPQDYAALKQAGVEAIFPPGTVVAEAAEGLLASLSKRLGHAQAAE
jgi:methylmalonyl-CoA mutase